MKAWWTERITRFYAKYAPEKTSADVQSVLEKTKMKPVQLEKLFQMLEQKYGPEPDPSSSEEEEEEEEDNEEEQGNEEEEELMKEIPGLRNVIYCPVDGVPPEYSEYFESFQQALPWLAARFPDLKMTTKSNMTIRECAEQLGIAPLEEGQKVAKSDKAQARKRGGVKKGDGKIIIEALERKGRKAITTLKGLEFIDGVKLKDAAKILGKKFACGASVKLSASSEEMIEIQGDVAYDLPAVLLEFFPSIKKDSVYSVDEDGKKQPAFD